MKHMKTLIFMLLCLTLFMIGTTAVNAQDDYYTTYDDTAPWAFWGLFTGALCIVPVIMFVIWIVLAIWVYKDAEQRGSSGGLWLIIVLITGILGLIIWLVVRPPIGGKPTQSAPQPPPQQQQGSERRCPSCGRVIPDDARVCPYCGKNFEG